MAGTQLDCYGIVSGNNIGSFTVVDGTDTGHAVGDYVEMLPTAAWGQDLADALTVGHLRTGAHVSSLPLTTPILTTPAIADFTSATHAHATNAQGGLLTASAFANNAITAPLLAATAITLGVASVTANQTGISTITDLTNLTLTVTVPAGGRDVEIQGLCQFDSSTSDDYALVYIFKDGSQVQAQARNLRSGSAAEGLNITYHDVAPTAGSHTYKLRASGNTSVALVASSTQPAQIVVKLV